MSWWHVGNPSLQDTCASCFIWNNSQPRWPREVLFHIVTRFNRLWNLLKTRKTSSIKLLYFFDEDNVISCIWYDKMCVKCYMVLKSILPSRIFSTLDIECVDYLRFKFLVVTLLKQNIVNLCRNIFSSKSVLKFLLCKLLNYNVTVIIIINIKVALLWYKYYTLLKLKSSVYFPYHSKFIKGRWYR